MTVRISSCVIELIRSAAEAAFPEEACGILFGPEGRIERASRCRNVAAEPAHRFEIDPTALIAALRAERDGGERVAGYWHSHPSGEARPSATDAAMAAGDGRLWVIVAGDEVRVWRAVEDGGVEGRFEAVMAEAD